MAAAPQPFRVEVPDAVLSDLGERLARTRWPDQIEAYGSDGARESQVVCLEVSAPWRPVEEYPNGWVSGCQTGQNSGAPESNQYLDFETVAS